MPAKLILASASPRRKLLLEQAGYDFSIQVGHSDEPDPSLFHSPRAYVAQVAWMKADCVRQEYQHLGDHVWILAADTTVSCGNEILGKPVDRADARRILTTLRGTRHGVHTGVCLHLVREAITLTAVETTDVAMVDLPDAAIEAYLDTGLWEGKAGAYGIQDHDDPFVEAIEGSWSNVVGLPMERLREMLAAAGRVDGGPIRESNGN